MANSTTNLDQMSPATAQHEVIFNSIVDALSPAALYGRRFVMTAGLTWGYYGGTVSISGTPTQVANGTVTLAASATNYIEANPSTGAVSVNQTGFTSGRTPLYQVVTVASTVSNYTDLRVLGGGGGGATSGDISDAIAAHEAESDPHPGYLTQAEGDARYATAGSGGTVTSVGLSAPSALLTISGSPVTGSGTLSMSLATQAVNTVFAGPASGGSAVPTFRSLTPADLPVMVGSGSSHAAGIVPDPGATAGTTRFLREDGTWASVAGASGGTVTSVSLTTPGLLFDVAGSPVTGSGTLAMTLKTQAANKFLAGPTTGADAVPTMRALVAADLPAQPFDVHAFYPGVPSASAIVTRIPVARAVTFPSGLSGSYGKASVAATSTTNFDVQKNGSSVGTISFAASATSATFTAASAITLAAGDILAIVAPSTADATLANVGFVLAGTR